MSPSSTRTDPRRSARMQCAGPDLNRMKTRFARLPGLKSSLQSCRSRTCSRQNMRGTGFEPDPDVLAPLRASGRVRIRSDSLTPADSLRSSVSVQCVGPDLNRRTSTDGCSETPRAWVAKLGQRRSVEGAVL